MSEKNSEIKNCLKEFALSKTSFYAIANIIKSKHFIGKFFWFFVLVGCTSFFTWFTFLMFKIQYEVVTRTQFHPEVITRFPGVTICNQNPFVTEYSNKILSEFFNKSEIRESYLDKNGVIRWSKLPELKFLIKAFAFNLSTKERNNLGYKSNVTILGCTFNMKECNSSEFATYYNFDYGNCIVFNWLGKSTYSSELKNVSINKKFYGGLHLDLFVGYNQTDYNSIFDQGAHIFIDNQSNYYFYSETDVPVGFQTDIRIKRSFIKKQPAPYSSCQNLEQMDYSNGKYKSSGVLTPYTQITCSLKCFDDYLVKKCNCSFPVFILIDNDSRRCNSISDWKCSINSSKYFYGSSVEINKCAESCPLECKSVKYSLTSSQIDYPSKGLANIIKLDPIIQEKFNFTSNISDEDLKNSLVSLNIYYDELGYTTIDEIASYDWQVFVTLVASNLGICFGLSFVSIFEIFEIVFMILKKIYDKVFVKDMNLIVPYIEPRS